MTMQSFDSNCECSAVDGHLYHPPTQHTQSSGIISEEWSLRAREYKKGRWPDMTAAYINSQQLCLPAQD